MKWIHAMRYIVAVGIISVLISNLVSAEKREHEIMMQEIRDQGAWLEEFNESQIGATE